MSRRAGQIARDHCLAPERVDAPVYGGRYRSLFEDLPPLRGDEAALHTLGRPGGPCDLGAGNIDADPESFRSVDPDWTPTLPSRRAGAFGLADILAPMS